MFVIVKDNFIVQFWAHRARVLNDRYIHKYIVRVTSGAAVGGHCHVIIKPVLPVYRYLPTCYRFAVRLLITTSCHC